MEALPRIDTDPALHAALLPFCRLAPGEIWEDPEGRHRVGCLDATDPEAVRRLAGDLPVTLALHDPPYNFAVGNAVSEQLAASGPDAFAAWCSRWMAATSAVLAPDAHLYVWLGADQRDGFQPLPEFMLMMRGFPELVSRSLITMRNQRGYGTASNWMSVRQELLYYVKGHPRFRVVYTEIPRLLKGYYKNVGGALTGNEERAKSPCIRPGNVWVDIQQVFYRMEENVPGCYAQKPLAAAARIIAASALQSGEAVLDLFAHSGTTLLSCERAGVACRTADLDPVFAEITIRRLEHYRRTGKTGWQQASPFPEYGKE